MAAEVSARKRGLEDLRPYQVELAEQLYADFGKKPGALLSVEMSLGKTVITATAVQWLLDTFQVRKVLIVAPLRVAQKTWPDEFRSWRHLSAVRWTSLVGEIGQTLTAKQRLALLKEYLDDPDSEIAIINRENVVWLYHALKDLGAGWPFEVLVYDESSRLKEGRKRTGTKRLSEFGVLAGNRKHMKYVIELTGTPSPRGVEDLWGQISLIDQGERLGTTRQQFLSRWFRSSQVGQNIHALRYDPKPGAEESIMEAVSDIMVSLKARDHVKLPPVMTYPDLPPILVDLTEKEMKQYRAFERTLAMEDLDVYAENKGVLAFKLLQFGQGSVYETLEEDEDRAPDPIHIHDHKIRALEQLVGSLNGESLLIAYAYKFDAARIRKSFPGVQLATDPGVLDAWNRREVRIMMAHPASVGHGLNLQFGGHHAVWYGLPTSLELYQQFNARLPRPGQTAETVFIHHILARDTFEHTRLINVLRERDATQDRITDAVKWHLAALRG